VSRQTKAFLESGKIHLASVTEPAELVGRGTICFKEGSSCGVLEKKKKTPDRTREKSGLKTKRADFSSERKKDGQCPWSPRGKKRVPVIPREIGVILGGKRRHE